MASRESGSIVWPNFSYRHKPQAEKFYLDAKEVIPPFSEVTGKVSSGLSNDLQANVMPRHSGHLAPIVHILLGLVESVKVCDSAIAIILACSV